MPCNIAQVLLHGPWGYSDSLRPQCALIRINTLVCYYINLVLCERIKMHDAVMVLDNIILISRHISWLLYWWAAYRSLLAHKFTTLF